MTRNLNDIKKTVNSIVKKPAKKQTNKEYIKNFIMDYLSFSHVACFAELELLFECLGVDYTGDKIVGDKNRNLIYWSGLSVLADDVLHELEQANKIAYVPGYNAETVYKQYGVNYDMPIAKDPNKKYKAPHWLPVLIVDEVARGLKKP